MTNKYDLAGLCSELFVAAGSLRASIVEAEAVSNTLNKAASAVEAIINAPGVAADKEELVPHSLAGFLARHFSLHREHASKQDIWDGGFRAARDLLAASPTPPSAATAPAVVEGERLGKAFDEKIAHYMDDHAVVAVPMPTNDEYLEAVGKSQKVTFGNLYLIAIAKANAALAERGIAVRLEVKE